uniref:Putative tumor necrosis factor-mediated signaling pathway n=1 Tax=Amblyomma aureolatum TaxID=187763 RepID=A0A1E1XCI0_9ACAR
MVIQRLRVKDGVGTFGEGLVPFLTPVPEYYLCSQCASIAEHMKSDSRGHGICDPCLKEVDKGGNFRCRRDGATELISEMKKCRGYYAEVLEFEVQCPREKSGCSFTGKLRQLRDHLPSCKPRRPKVCPRCFSRIESLPAHIKNSCPKRLISCEYCHEEKEAWTMNHHIEECDRRPATCEYCKETVESYAKLWNDHLAVCPEKPTPCSFKEFGCTFMGTKAVYEEHMKGNSHTELLVKVILDLKEQQAAALMTQRNLDARIRCLETQIASLFQPLGNLLDETAKLK